MPYSTLINPPALRPLLGNGKLALFDCRHALMDPAYGRKAYDAGHLPGALFADMDHHLAAPPSREAGRHPLPDLDVFAAWLGTQGVGEGVQVVAYDDGPGAFAARLWWMLRYLGHDAVAVLDGGLKAWMAEDGPIETAEPQPTPRIFTAHPTPALLAPLEEVAAHLEDGSLRLIDARALERYEGKSEPLDPVAGHIPGAQNLPFDGNLGQDGRFLLPDALKARFTQRLGGHPPQQAVHYCGSGVTACHNLLAQAHAGLAQGRLYPGSWSQWCGDPARPVESGPSPR